MTVDRIRLHVGCWLDKNRSTYSVNPACSYDRTVAETPQKQILLMVSGYGSRSITRWKAGFTEYARIARGFRITSTFSPCPRTPFAF